MHDKSFQPDFQFTRFASFHLKIAEDIYDFRYQAWVTLLIYSLLFS